MPKQRNTVPLFSTPPRLTRPGIFVTGTDTGVGKTAVSCAIAAALRNQRRGIRVGVCKPMATGCRRDREGLVSEDAEALAHFADCRQPLDVINPVRYIPPVAPAVAAEMTGEPVEFGAISRCLEILDETSDAMIVEGVGGLLVPIDHRDSKITVLDLAVALGYPVVVVCRAALGTLNHTAMTVSLLKSAGLRVAGLVVNFYEADVARVADASVPSNRAWLERMNRVPILATTPQCPPGGVAPERAIIAPAFLDAVALTYWSDVLSAPAPSR